MTESEALQALKLEGGFEICGRATRVAEFLKGLDIAEKAIKKQVEMQPIRDYNNDIKKIGVPARHAKQDGSFVYRK